MIPSPKCDLPALPDAIQPRLAEGPTPDTFVIGKPDVAAIVGYVTGLQDWIVAAMVCIESRGK